jgi:hypothetical protein
LASLCSGAEPFQCLRIAPFGKITRWPVQKLVISLSGF